MSQRSENLKKKKKTRRLGFKSDNEKRQVSAGKKKPNSVHRRHLEHEDLPDCDSPICG